MSMNYRLADMFAQIRNGQQARLAEVKVQASKLLGNVLEVLKNEGFINDYEKVEEGKKSRVSKLSSNITKAKTSLRKSSVFPSRAAACIAKFPSCRNITTVLALQSCPPPKG